MSHDPFDGAIAHRGHPDLLDEGGPRPYRPAVAPTEEIDGMGEFGRGMTAAPRWRRQIGRAMLALFALGLLAPFIVLLPFLFD